MSDFGLFESPFGVRWTTLAMGATIVAVVGARRRPFVGVVTAAAWMTAFEIPYQIADALTHHRDAHLARTLGQDVFWLATVAGWIGWAHALGVRPDARWALLSAAIFALWVAQGLPYNFAGQTGPVQWWPELLNVGSKTALGVAYMLGAVAPSARPAWATRSGQSP
ncbi:MAG: hypothetical protein E6J41_21715 [Chloroflexi bacterium]|nr:MAG: hypothetical protein E6J41_21715 [Chloroflexota bacterium]